MFTLSPAEGALFLWVRNPSLHRADSAQLFLWLVTLTFLASGSRWRCRSPFWASCAWACFTADRLRKNGRIGYVGMLAFAILLPTVDPVSLVLETVPLLVLFEASIWIAVFMERRWERTAAEAL